MRFGRNILFLVLLLITLGSMLISCTEEREHTAPAIYDRDSVPVMKESAERVLWFVYFCNKEVERINKLFEAIKPHFDSEEKQAGVDRLKFGSFGILDWYARRMRITDQNEVRNVPWVRIYKCMKNDNELREYDRRLREVYKRKSNR